MLPTTIADISIRMLFDSYSMALIVFRLQRRVASFNPNDNRQDTEKQPEWRKHFG
jgi:hypothetical protein